MNNTFLTINPAEETKRITDFLQHTAERQKISKVVLGLSGGIDSTVSFYLLQKVFTPKQLVVARLSYFPPKHEAIDTVIDQSALSKNHIYRLSIKPLVDAAQKTAEIQNSDPLSAIRLGNIMARSRMILLYDLARKHDALVCGTENKSEMLLGYFTRFGDEASDIEPIRHLYKSQIYQLATYLGIPKEIITQAPTAGLWQGQTDEGQFGFTYEEADGVLYWYHDKKLNLREISKKGYPNAEKIITHVKINDFKHHVPYSL